MCSYLKPVHIFLSGFTYEEAQSLFFVPLSCVLFYLVGRLVLVVFFDFFCGVGSMVSLYSFGCPRIHHVSWTGLKLTEVSLPLTPECQVLRPEVCTIMPNLLNCS